MKLCADSHLFEPKFKTNQRILAWTLGCIKKVITFAPSIEGA